VSPRPTDHLPRCDVLGDVGLIEDLICIDRLQRTFPHLMHAVSRLIDDED
jgi:hypothetical protein